MPALDGIHVVDFSTLLPGPLATLVLAQAGARITKIERPAGGDEMRGFRPAAGSTGANFAKLNAGKTTVVADLKNPADRDRVIELIATCDVVVEQFRPGVMDRLGLGYETLAAVNPRLVYCSITGYGQYGPKAQIAGHDLTYLADTGMLELGEPVVPPALVADIGAGTMPAVINVLLALIDVGRTGRGHHLDIAMTDQLFPYMYWALANTEVGQPPRPAGELVSGGSPRYNVYRAGDGRYIAAAPLEERFWVKFCAEIGLSPDLRDDSADPAATQAAVAAAIATRPAAEWAERFRVADIPAVMSRTLTEALADPHFAERGLFAGQVRTTDGLFGALPPTVAPGLRVDAGILDVPLLDATGPVSLESH